MSRIGMHDFIELGKAVEHCRDALQRNSETKEDGMIQVKQKHLHKIVRTILDMDIQILNKAR